MSINPVTSMEKMKNSSAFRTFFLRRFGLTLMMLGLMLSTIALTNGCSKKNTSSPAPSVSTAPAPTNQPEAVTQPSRRQLAVSAPQTNCQPDLDAVQRALLRWIVGHKRRPANFEEFAASSGTPLPPPPPGKKYVILPNMHVQLVNQ